MSFLARENKQSVQQQPNRAFGRGLHGDVDHVKAEQKLAQQQQYKMQLQRQILEKQARKKQEEEKIWKQNAKIQREIEEMNKKEKQRNDGNKQKNQKRMQPAPTVIKRQQNAKQNKGNRGLIGNFNVAVQQHPQRNIQVPKLGFQLNYEQIENMPSNERRRPYYFQQNEQMNSYYEQRMKKHKQQMNQKLDELFHHINSTKDNIKAQQQIEKIRRRLRAKQSPSMNQLNMGESRLQLEYQNKFFNIPKKNNEVYTKANQDKSRVLDYQSRSKFTGYKNTDKSQSKVKTHNDDMYSLPQASNQQSRVNRWGSKPGKDNFLANRQAIDFEAESILGKIDDYLDKLKS